MGFNLDTYEASPGKVLVFIPDFCLELLDVKCAIWEIFYGAWVHTTKLKICIDKNFIVMK